ncbi:DgyrCDS8950 [Dimorphilus gyrociliatus]|uniref:DgyrCDS8950 n=1 Tax=Dimorphilus gyrociliatus TaxID=2664684 RepID=A0A7I8VWV8_9ANNE|nr:DgyrCDS8950 [Dimorphilus gyrociliatus]
MSHDSEDESSYPAYSNPLWKFSKNTQHRSQDIPNNCWKGFSVKNNLPQSKEYNKNYTPWSGHFRSKQRYTYGSKENHKKFTHRCESCDRGFPSEEILQKHLSEHEKCPECNYSASSGLINLHYKHHHMTGLANKIWKKESKEDIEKWIMERKKKYPTIKKIEEQKSTKPAKNVLEKSQIGFKKTNKKRKRKPRKQKEKNDLEKKEIIKSDDPLSKLQISESEDGEQVEKIETDRSASVNTSSALSALQSMYSSDDEEEVNKDKDTDCPAKKSRVFTKPKNIKKKLTKPKKNLTAPKTRMLRKRLTPAQTSLRMKRPSLLTMVAFF